MNLRTTTVRQDTHKSLKLAISRIQQGVPTIVPVGSKLTIAAVAKEAGVSNATIHNRYPDIAEEIRSLMPSSQNHGSGIRQKALKDCSDKLTKARKEIKELKEDLAKSQSINLRLMKENELLSIMVREK